jgi:hypothetical protein
MITPTRGGWVLEAEDWMDEASDTRTFYPSFVSFTPAEGNIAR